MIASIGKPINNFFSWYLEKRIDEIHNFINDPYYIQEKTLLNLIKSAKSTEFGKKYDFNNILNSHLFKSKIELNHYQDLKPFINKMKNGDSDILWPGQVKWFAQSSGTSNKEIKHIPITKQSLWECHYKGGKDLLSLYYHENPSTQLFRGKHLIAGGTSFSFVGNKKTVIGDLSAIIMQHLPWWCEWRRSPKGIKKVISENWRDKLNYIIESSINDDIHIIAGVPSWIYLILHEIIERYNLTNINEIWPNLELFLHGGVNIGPYKNNFNDIFDKKINFYQNYNATEGFFGLQSENNSDDMLLMLDYGIYYEFISKKDWSKEQPTTLSLEEINLNEPYEMVISTNGGLWRYRLQDTIIFTEKKPFKIKVIGRTQQFLNVFGEELMICHLENAVKKAAERLNLRISEFTVCPVILKNHNSLGFHHWVFEFINQPDDINDFSTILDQELKKTNIDYLAKRKNNSPITKPKLSIVRCGTFHNWMQKRGKIGGQNKVPKISNSNKYVKQLLEINKDN